jgi:hypothetical protein
VSGSEGHDAIGRAYLRLIGIAALVGIPAAFLAALFLGAVHLLQRWLWDDLPAALGSAAPLWFLVLGLPVAGAGIVLLESGGGAGCHRRMAHRLGTVACSAAGRVMNSSRLRSIGVHRRPSTPSGPFRAPSDST